MRIVVDLNRCQSYGQCVFAAPEVFRFRGEESLEYDHVPGPDADRAVQRAALACPVQAITIGRSTETPANALADTHSVAPTEVTR
ncbi:MAG TPA: ferredoxin [Pseudonocardiaceae bacterium]|jgi:ferredoxin|nr:ferredoxin [Pseudonocardiaceae bacterium]